MRNWELFESKCYTWLKEKFASYNAEFSLMGGENSTISDIFVENYRNGNSFFIEVKKKEAQCGQFVLKPDFKSRKFIFSEKNKSEENDYVKQILNFMNGDFEKLYNGGVLAISNELIANWIIDYYKNNKNVKYFISYFNDFVILPIDKISDYFHLGAVFRVKRSGSKNPLSKDTLIINNALTNAGYKHSGLYFIDKYAFIRCDDDIDQMRIWINGYEYFFKKTNTVGVYSVTRLSNTFNMNVIFHIKCKKSQDYSDLETFIQELR